MRAMVYSRYGSPDVLRLETRERPEPGERELRVKVCATTVNRTDCHMLGAKPFIMRFITGLVRPRNPILGTSFSGIVEAVGDAVQEYAVGDAVFGFSDSGVSAYADYLVIAQGRPMVHKPVNVSHAEAAASVDGAHYAYNNVNRIKHTPEQRVLVNGASGAVGIAALQLLKHYGAQVTAVGNGASLPLLRELGADAVIDHERQDFTRCGQTFDAIIDAVGKSTFAKCRRLLNPGGIYLPSEMGWLAQNFVLALLTPLFQGRKVIFPFPLNTQRSLRVVSELLASGAFKAVIDRTYPFAQIADAFRYVASGQKTGNVVIDVDATQSD